MTFYVIKYLFTAGIQEEENCRLSSCGKYVWRDRDEGCYLACTVGVNAFETRAQALEAAKRMCVRKLQVLRKQIAKVQKLEDELREAQQ